MKMNYTYAKDDSIGAERKDWNGNIWKKIDSNKWHSNSSQDYSRFDQGDYVIYYSDSQVDGFPGGANEYSSRFYDYTKQIQRSLYIDNVLYTISPSKIKANNLNDLKEIDEVDLGFNQESYPVAVY